MKARIAVGTDDELAGDVAAGVGEAVDGAAARFAAERQHAFENFADGSAIVCGDPAGEFEQICIEDRFFVTKAEHFTRFGFGRRVVSSNNDTGEIARTEGRYDATAGAHTVAQGERQFVSENSIDRDGGERLRRIEIPCQASNSPMLWKTGFSAG